MSPIVIKPWEAFVKAFSGREVFVELWCAQAHERTLHTDILFGLVKDLLAFRKDFKVGIGRSALVSSA